MKLKLLRKYIREMLELFEDKDKEDESPDNLLTEPDDVDDPDEKKEVATGGVPGAQVPLGADATYPSKRKKRKKKKPVYGKVTSDQ